jgi:hypothetical protein
LDFQAYRLRHVKGAGNAVQLDSPVNLAAKAQPSFLKMDFELHLLAARE